jgi:hypothetical protein
MIRRLKKVTSQAELQQLIDAGIIVSPYIAFDSSSNVTNMVLPAEREISEIEYEQEVSGPVKLVGAITPEYYVQEGFTACRLSFTVHPDSIDGHDVLFLLMCQKAWFDEAYVESGESTRESFISILLSNAYNRTDNILNFSYAYAVNINSRSAFPFDTDVPYVVSAENMAGDDLMWVPYDNSYPNDNTYYLFYGYDPTGKNGIFDIVGEVAQYRVMPYLSDSSTFVYNGMDLVAYEKLDPVTGESMGQYRNFEARVPGNTVYDRARYAWYLDGESDAEALENGRTAVCDASTTFSFSDYNAPEYINDTDQTLEGFIVVQLYNSVTGAESKVKNFSTMYVEPTEGGDDSSIRLLGSINRTPTIGEFDNVVTDLDFTASIKPYDGEEDFSTIYPVFCFIRKSDFDDFAEVSSSKYPDWSRNQLIWNYIDDNENFGAEPDDTPDQWDSSVHFTCNSMETPLLPEEVEGDDANYYTYMLVAIYSNDGDMAWGGDYPGDDYVFELGQIQIPFYSPVTLDSSILYEIGHAPYDEYPDFEAKLKIGSYTDNFSEEGYSDLKMMFVNKGAFDSYVYNHNIEEAIEYYLNDNDPVGTWTLDLDSSTQGYYVTSWYNDATTGSDDFDCMYMPNASQDVYEEELDMYTYYLIAGHYNDKGDIGTYALSLGIVGKVVLPYYLESTPANILKYGNLWKNDNDGTIVYNFEAQVTPNSCYPKFAIGLYSQQAFETAYSESGTSDSSTEYLNTFQDDGQMFEYYSADYDENYPFNFSDIFDPEDIPGYTEGDTICMALWFLDENDDISGDVTYVATLEEEGEGDDTPDVSLGYKFSVGANNGGYFNTGYVPGADTVVQLKGKIINDGASAHGIKGNYSDWMYRIFGNEGDVYFDRMDDQVRIVAAVNDIENTSHEYEFGNYYIKVDGVTEATDSESDLSNFYTEISLLVFATSQIGAMGETILDTLASQGTEVEYFKILEPDGNGGLNLEKDLRPALDASGNVCLYDQVAGDIIYPEGSDVNIVATAISGNEPGPDSSSGDSSTSEGPTLTFSSTDLTYNTVADFVPVISGDDSYYDSVAFFVIPDSMIADTLSDNPGWTMADAVWSLVENEDTRSVGLDSSSGDTVDLSGILNTYYDNQEVYVVALLEHYEVGEYPVYYQPDDEAGNYAYEAFEWGEPTVEEPEEPEEEPEE